MNYSDLCTMFTRNLFCRLVSNIDPLTVRVLLPTLHKSKYYYATLNKSVITDLSLDIDLNGLKDEQMRRVKLGETVNIHKLVNDTLEQKCSAMINQFDADHRRTLKIIQFEHSFLYAEGYAVPSPENMTNRNWIEAMTCPSKDDRFLYYLYIDHKANLKTRTMLQGKKKARDQLTHSDLELETDKGFILHQEKASSWGNHCLASAMTHGIPLVFDMEFDDSMTSKDFGHAAQQLWYAYLTNRAHRDPFHFIFTGRNRKNVLYRTLELRHLLSCQHFLVSETENSYLDLFDRSQLVYLSSHSKHVLKRFDPSHVYILGAYSDPKNRKQFGPPKASEQGIKCFKLPIDEHVKWIQGNKDLLLQTMVKILLSVKGGGEWTDAFDGALRSGNFRHYGKDR